MNAVQVLGRADQLSSFVMHGVKDDASVTVELFQTGENVKIKRTFSRKSNASNWSLNGMYARTQQCLWHTCFVLSLDDVLRGNARP